MTIVRKRRSSKIDHVLASGLQWRKNTLAEATKIDPLAEMMWTANLNEDVECRIIRRSEGHYFWSVLQTLDTGVVTFGSGKTNALAFWYAADDIANEIKPLVKKAENSEEVA